MLYLLTVRYFQMTANEKQTCQRMEWWKIMKWADRHKKLKKEPM